jgi:hypothetical protein
MEAREIVQAGIVALMLLTYLIERRRIRRLKPVTITMTAWEGVAALLLMWLLYVGLCVFTWAGLAAGGSDSAAGRLLVLVYLVGIAPWGEVLGNTIALPVAFGVNGAFWIAVALGVRRALKRSPAPPR